MIGEARVTAICAVSLSKVTVRGEEMTFESEYVFRKCRTALTPSAFRNVAPPLTKDPLDTLAITFEYASESGAMVLAVGTGPAWRLFPKAIFWFCSVPDQSIPLVVVGLIEVSSNF